MALKHELAHSIVSRIHEASAADGAADEFRRVVQRKEIPDDIPSAEIAVGEGGDIKLFDLLVKASLAPSKSEARRLVQQGAVTVAQEKQSDPTALFVPGEYLVQVGKRRFAKVQLRP